VGYQEPWGFTACLLGGAQAPLSNRHFKQLLREIVVAQPNAGKCLMKWSTSKIGFDEEDHSTSTKGVGTRLPLITSPSIVLSSMEGRASTSSQSRSLKRCRCCTIGSCQLDRSSG
jgi:hypothetical protein